VVSTRVAYAALVTLAASAPAHADVVISADPTQNMSCSGGFCAPTKKDAVLNVTDFENLLASGNVTVVTTNGSVQANNIDIADAFSWSAANSLTLDAYQSISFSALAKVKGKGSVSIVTNDGGTAGVLSFAKKGRLVFSKTSDALSINGVAYALVNSIPLLAVYIQNNPSAAVALASDYDASSDGVYTKPPIFVIFTGALEGLGNTISNFQLMAGTGVRYSGLLQQNEGVIRDLRLTHANLVGGKHAYNMGVLTTYNSGVISNCSATGTVSSGDRNGGYDNGFGGLVGLNAGGTIAASHANVAITTKSGDAGGLVGQNQGGAISLSSATGSVSCSSAQCQAGGLVGGSSSGSIDQSFATGSVSATRDVEYVGGLVGIAGATITNSYATGSATSSYYGGGFGGYFGQNSSIATSYSTGVVKGKNFKGGFDGANIGSTANSYWDTDTSGQSQGSGDGNETGLTGLTTEEFQSGLPAAFDPAIWAEDANINNGFPYLIANPPPK